MTDEPKTVENPPKRRGRVAVWHGLRVMWLLATLPVLFAIVAAAMMIDRDVTAPSWLRTRVEAQASQMLGGGTLRFGEITMNVGRDLHPRMQLRDTVLTDASGATLARIAQISGVVSPRGLVFDRAALVQEVALVGVQIDLQRNVDGSVAVSFGQGTAQQKEAASLQALLANVDAVFDQPALAAFEAVHAKGVVINYADARAGRAWTADDGELRLNARGGRTRLEIDLAVLSGGTVGEVNLAFDSPRDSAAARVQLDLRGVPAQDIATQSPALAWLGALDAPMTATLSTAFSDTGALGDVHADLKIGAGGLRGGGQDTHGFRFDGADVALTYVPATQRLKFEQIALATDWGQITGQGQAFPETPTDGLPQSLIGQFFFPDLRLNPGGIYEEPVAMGAASVDLRLHLQPFALDVGQIVLASDAGTIAGRGHVKPAAGGWDAALDLRADRITRARLLELWPQGTQPGGRSWFEQNLTRTKLQDLHIGWRTAPEVPDRMALQFEFVDTDLRIFKQINPVRNARGVVSMHDNRVVIALADGTVQAPEGGQLDLAGSVMTIPDIGVVNPPVELDLHIDSSITGVLTVLNQPPFGLMDLVKLSPRMADGRATAIARMNFPLKNPVPSDELRFDVGADLRRVTSETLIPDRNLRASALRLDADNAQISIGGRITLDGVPLTGQWSQVIGQPQSQVVAQIELSPQTLDAFAITLPPGTVQGQGEGRLALDLQRGSAPRFRLTSDLRGIDLRIPQVSVRKAPNVSGDLTVVGRMGQRPEIETLQLRAAGLAADGRIELDNAGQLAAARFSRVAVGGWLDAPVTLRGRGAGRPVGVEVSGGLLDLRAARFGPPTGGEGGPIDVSLDRLQVTEGVALRGFRGQFTSTGGLAGTFTARVNNGPGVRGTVAPQKGRTALRLQSDDAGGVVAAAGYLGNGVGGNLDLSLIPAGAAGSFDGLLSIQGIRIKDAPAIAALLDAISVVGLLQQLDGQGLAFDDVEARFRLTPDQIIVTESSAVGPGLGISLDGIYTLARKSFDFQGVVSPFYILNGLGSVLTRRGEGLIGFSFTITGDGDAPNVSVNPLSAFTPGMFREIFRRPPPQVTP